MLDNQEDTHNYEFLNYLQNLYNEHSKDFSRSYVSYTNNEKGERWRKQLEIPEQLNSEELRDK
ncbi:hypothetical protein, partial [Vibrio parahaemolyticus]|uniref:hypothetical protein n=1 Tax=Vibrio parahaemolyticus TaxID=670 RepID=UPI001C5F3708